MSFKWSVSSWVSLSYLVIDRCDSCRWGAVQPQRIQGPRWDTACVCGVMELQAGRIKEPFAIGQLIRPHDVEEGRAECLQFLTGVRHLRQGAKWALPLVTITLNAEKRTWTQTKKNNKLLTTNSKSTGLPMSSRLRMALSPLTDPLKNSWRGSTILQVKKRGSTSEGETAHKTEPS